MREQRSFVDKVQEVFDTQEYCEIKCRCLWEKQREWESSDMIGGGGAEM